MKNHPDKNQLLKAAAGLDKNTSIMEHIGSCPDCAKYFQDITQVLLPSDNSHLTVPENVENRIIDSYRYIKLNDVKTKVGINRFSGFLNPAIAAFILVAAVVVTGLFYNAYYKDEDRKISFKGIYGDTFVNGVKFDEILISSGDKIITKTASSSELEVEKMFFINLYPDTEIELENSYYSKKEKMNVFNFKISSGTIYAKFEKTGDLKYRFVTADVRIESIGTEFLIETSNEGTTVIVTEGSLAITSLKSGETKIAGIDKIYKVKNNIEISDVDKSSEIEEALLQKDMTDRPDHQKSENKISLPEKKSTGEAENKVSESKINNSDNKDEARKMMKEAKKEINREMRGEMRKEMKKERGGFGK